MSEYSLQETLCASALMHHLERRATEERARGANDGKYTIFFRGLKWEDVIPEIRAVLSALPTN